MENLTIHAVDGVELRKYTKKGCEDGLIMYGGGLALIWTLHDPITFQVIAMFDPTASCQRPSEFQKLCAKSRSCEPFRAWVTFLGKYVAPSKERTRGYWKHPGICIDQDFEEDSLFAKRAAENCDKLQETHVAVVPPVPPPKPPPKRKRVAEVVFEFESDTEDTKKKAK